MKQLMFKAAMAALVVLSMAGCGEDRPGDKVAEPAVRQIAEGDLADGLEIVDFKRANGQVDPDSANRYKVTYSYRLQLTRSYGEVILGLAQGLLEEIAPAREPARDLDFSALEQSVQQMQLAMLASQWINAQDGRFPERRDAMLASCAPCASFWESADAPAEADTRRMAFIVAWSHLEEMAFEDGFKVGDGVDRNAWQYFAKTEKGWQPAS